MEHKYGNFNNEGNEFIITEPNTPRAFDNFLWNDAVFSNVQQTGVGYFDYQIGDNEAVQLLTGVGRICDFDVFGRDHLMSRLIYVRDNDTGEFWNVNWEPVKKKYDKYECIHGLGYTIIKTTVNGITSELKIFVPQGNDPVELWTLKTKNLSAIKRNISIFVYNQFQFKFKWGFDSYGDMIYRSSWFNKELNAVVAVKNPYRRPHNYLTGFMTSDEPIVAFDGTRDAFVGLYNTLQEPVAVVNGRCTNTPGSSDATIGVMQFDFELEKNQEKVISIILGATDDEKNIEQFRQKYLGDFNKYFNELKVDKNLMSARNRVKTPDEHLNKILNNWVKQQTLYGATWVRWGWNGYRDIVQHGLGVSTIEPDRTKKILLEALKYQYKSGLALRGWNPVDEKPYSDSALWLVFTLTAYLKETGDLGFLDEVVDYYDEGSATVLQHINQALDFLEKNKGSHGLILIKFGDWNDSLTAVGKEGRGESVWLSEAYAVAMDQMAGLAEYMGDENKKQDYLKRLESITKAINGNAWDGKWYTRCFDDNGKPVGSNLNKEGKIFMESQSWALIAKIADKARTEELIKSCNELLLTEVGYRLLAPTFTKIDDSVGRISSMQQGICENGTVYSHVNIWMILGLLKAHKADEAYKVFQKITPGYIKDENDPKHKCPPYIYSNCYYGPDHKNNKFQMEFTWVTGSVAWFNNVLLREMLGAKAEYNGLLIDPCIPSEWSEYEVERNFRNSIYHIMIKNPEHIQHGELEISVDGKRINSNLIPVFSDGGRHEVKVLMKK
jgi:cellobiose phosphorylase